MSMIKMMKMTARNYNCGHVAATVLLCTSMKLLLLPIPPPSLTNISLPSPIIRMTLSERRSAGIVHTKIDTLNDTDEEDEMKAAAAIEFQFAKGRGGWSK